MLVPNFSIRWLLGMTTAAAFFFLVVNFAIAGQTWAYCAATAIVFLMLAFVFYGIMFFFAFWLTQVTRFAQPKPKPTSPFATDSLPPQIIAPVDRDP
jgi:hypothetical protein